jgi:uncharacterized protein YgbK (DUF1537 family)
LPELLIVADDLTGAADCGLPFAARGFATAVTLSQDRAALDADADVLAIDGDTRWRSQEEAARETARLVARWAPSCRTVFKKIDSTLRGHVGPEIAAALRALRAARGSGLVVMTPAFPALGRAAREGRLFVRGVPLEDTELGRGSPRPGPARIPGLLDDAGLRTAVIGLDVLRSGVARVRAEMARHAESGDVLACDAETDDDLRAIVAGARSLGRPLAWAGSAGLAQPVAEAMSEGRARRPSAAPPLAGGPILFVVGSPSAVSREQVSALAMEPPLTTVVSIAADVHAGEEPGARVEAALASGRDVVVTLEAPRPGRIADGRRVAAGVGRLVASHGRRVGALVLIGGDTARAVLEALGVVALRLWTQVEPGVPLSTSEGARRIPVITKAGAFGDRETLMRCRAALRRGPAWGH